MSGSSMPAIDSGLRANWSTKLNLLFNLSVLIVFFFLDLRDLYYKTQWIGPFDAFVFTATSIDPFHDRPLRLATPRNATGGQTVQPFASGWGSFLQPCDNLTAVSAGSFFLHVVASNCRFGNQSNPEDRAKNVYLVANFRPDAVMWASCQLVLPDRQPSICQSALVSNFLARYHMEMPEIPVEWMALPDTPEEQELLALMNVVGCSSTLSRMTCVSGFDFDLDDPVGTYNLTLFGCGSADHHQAAIVGRFATSLHHLLEDKMWSTSDDLNLMGFHFSIRQNSKAYVVISQVDPSDRLSLRLTHASAINFASHGSLYVTLLAIDCALMMINLLTALELAIVVVHPFVAQQATQEEIDLFSNKDCLNFFSRSLYRSHPVMWLAITTQLLSWMIILPNAIIWTWNMGGYPQFQSMLSTLRLWALLLILLNGVWDLVVMINEQMAFEISRRTYLTTVDIITIGLGVCYLERNLIFAIGGKKYALEQQRLADFDTFLNPLDNYTSTMLAYGISFNEDLDYLISTPHKVLVTLYAPLFRVMGESLLALAGFALLKLLFFRWTGSSLSINKVTCLHQQEVTANQVVAATFLETTGTTSKDQDDFKAKPHIAQMRGKPTPLGESVRRMFALYRRRSSLRIKSRVALRDGKYARLPLEELLDTPIRARSLVRTSLEFEIIVGEFAYLRPPIYFDFGVFVHKGVLKTRAGFLSAIEPQICLTHHTDKQNGRQFVSANVPLR